MNEDLDSESLVGRKVTVHDLGAEYKKYEGAEATIVAPGGSPFVWAVQFKKDGFTGVYEFFHFKAIPVSFDGDSTQPQFKMNPLEKKKKIACIQAPDSKIMFNISDIEFERYCWNFDPDKFKPQPDTDGMVRYWGVKPCDPSERFTARNCEQLYARFLFSYGEMGCPENQIATILSQKKLKAIKSSKSSRSIYRKLNYTLRITLDNIQPMIFRDFVVSGGMTLRTLADKVIEAVMGWARGYHSYIYVHPNDGSCYGQHKSRRGIDQMFMFAYGFDFIDDELVRLGDLVGDVGDKLLFVYDLGVRWEHTITVLEAIPTTSSSRTQSDGLHCKCINGANSCPPEDGNGQSDNHPHQSYDNRQSLNGNSGYMNAISPGGILATRSTDKTILEKHENAINSTNFVSYLSTKHIKYGKYFHWEYFNIEEVNERLVDALQICSTTCLCCAEDFTRPETEMKNLLTCGFCGNPNKLSWCGQCRMVAYCSREHQRLAWPAHKKQCKELKELHQAKGALGIY
eukprot:gene12704-17036_t